MKRFASWCYLGVLFLGACNSAGSPAAPVEDEPADLRAFQFTENSSFPLNQDVFVSCAAGGAGEWVHLTGNLHAVFHVTISNSANFSVKSQFQPQGVSGRGESTGARYQGNGVTQEMDHLGRVGEAFSYVNNFQVIGSGRGNNFVVHEVIHITVNANGTLTSFLDGFRASCQ